MPTKAQKLAIEQHRLGLRVVDDGGRVDSGSCYYLFPVESDWDKKLKETAEIYRKASAPGKQLHLLADLVRVESGEFSSGGFAYGRVTGRPRSAASVSLYGNESADSIEGWVLRQITALQPAERTLPLDAEVPSQNGPSAFARCCAAVAYVFCCCRPEYRRVEDDDALDLT